VRSAERAIATITLDRIPDRTLSDLGLDGRMIRSMWRKLAAIAAIPLMIVLAVPAHADPNDANDANVANDAVFLQTIAGDGIVMDDHEAILEAHAVCRLMEPPNDGSLWDAGQQVKSMNSGWGIGAALHFADRSVQDICPNRGSF
jgi:hypothetical protein